ncbi:hypothetical protein H257_19236 [Aphanomyces astaci]|uniref:Tf2-1-like SH3-like domain-containing protein n=1 Tax=Aphanomyces astaci TaxID=112090 RepID=W4FAJ9_APHAT|nr:hypothetical protein H257_19236 [Aphanomyces astaci]ETV63831.1 hypothetical protein H257_19236 [Aphanomyces astaci]|eukprot:XP_009846685.1 hypothetical protein H257_19236 [Aphanomyces astaci]
MQLIHDNIAVAQQRQSSQANKHGRSNLSTFAAGDQVLLLKSAVPVHAFRTREVRKSSNVKLGSAWHGPFTVLRVVSPTYYKLDVPTSSQIHPTFYVGKLKQYLPTTDVVTANNPLDSVAAPLPLLPPSTSPPPPASPALKPATSQTLHRVRAAYLPGRRSVRQTERPSAHASVAARRRN